MLVGGDPLLMVRREAGMLVRSLMACFKSPKRVVEPHVVRVAVEDELRIRSVNMARLSAAFGLPQNLSY